VAGEKRPLHLRANGVLESNDPGQCGQPIAQPAEQVLLHLGLDRTGLVVAGEQISPRAGKFRWRDGGKCGHLLTVRRRRRERDSSRKGARMWDGNPDVLPVQGAIVALVFLVIAFVKVFRGVKGSDAIIWNTVGVITLLYLFTSVAWFASGGFS